MAIIPFTPRDRSATFHIGTVTRTIFASPSRDFCILALADGATVLGPADADDLPEGTSYKFLGSWQDSEKKGMQFRFQTYIPHLMHGHKGVTTYLSKVCSGFGEKRASKLWQKYAAEAVQLLREHPEQVASECDLPLPVCQEAARELSSAKKYEGTRIDLFQLTTGRGLGGPFIEAAIEKWGTRAPAMIKRNPFAALGLPQAGFKRMDKMWVDLGLPKNSLKRAGIISWNLVQRDNNGHTWLSAATLAERLREVVPEANPARAFKFALRVRKLKKHRDPDEALWLASYSRATAEERIAANITRLMSSESIWPIEHLAPGPDGKPSAHQIDRLRKATARPVGILIGSPGTGKTTSVAVMLREAVASFGMGSLILAAPTGKAAVRMTQALTAAGLDGLTARTLHTTLEIGRNGHDGDGWEFQRNRKNPLDCKFLIVDEVSMCDATLMADTLDAIPNGGHVLFIGDPGQLPPVGHGAPLRDMLAGGVPHGELTEVRRNAGMIVTACARIKENKPFEVCDRVDLESDPPANLLLIEAGSDKAIADRLVDALRAFTRFNPVWETQVLVARNKNGEVSRKALNERLQPLLNPDGLSAKDNPFRVNDKIICLKNSRMRVVETFYTDADPARVMDAKNYTDVLDTRDYDKDAQELYVANGEIGRVVAVAPKLCVARFSDGESLVKIPMGKDRGDDEDATGGEESGRGCNFDLGYAITTHKSQGSEFPCVIVVGDEGGGQITNAEWVYTAISRAAKLCILIGKKATFEKMRMRVGLSRRKTFLAPRVRDALRDLPALFHVVEDGPAEMPVVRCLCCGTDCSPDEARCFVCLSELVPVGTQSQSQAA